MFAAALLLFAMGCSTFFFIESKTLEFSIEEGVFIFFLLQIFERGHTSMRSVFFWGKRVQPIFVPLGGVDFKVISRSLCKNN